MRDEYFLLNDEIFEHISSLIEDMNNYILSHCHSVMVPRSLVQYLTDNFYQLQNSELFRIILAIRYLDIIILIITDKRSFSKIIPWTNQSTRFCFNFIIYHIHNRFPSSPSLWRCLLHYYPIKYLIPNSSNFYSNVINFSVLF